MSNLRRLLISLGLMALGAFTVGYSVCFLIHHDVEPVTDTQVVRIPQPVTVVCEKVNVTEARIEWATTDKGETRPPCLLTGVIHGQVRYLY